MQLHRAYDGGEWITGTSFIYDEITETWFFYDDVNKEKIWVDKPEPQIGEVDKNGKDVYLHDIIRHRLGTGVIRYAKGEYYVDWESGLFHVSRLAMLENTYEVIGNVTQRDL